MSARGVTLVIMHFLLSRHFSLMVNKFTLEKETHKEQENIHRHLNHNFHTAKQAMQAIDQHGAAHHLTDCQQKIFDCRDRYLLLTLKYHLIIYKEIINR